MSAIFLGTTPLSIQMISTNLDCSWVFLINTALEQGLKFGTDLMFTYGPLGFLTATVNIGKNIPIAIAFCVVLKLCEAWLLLRLFTRLHGRKGLISIFACAVILLVCSPWLGMEYYIHFLFFLAISLAWTEKSPRSYLIFSMVLSVITMLIKFNAGVMCIVTLVLFALGKLILEKRSGLGYIKYFLGSVVLYVILFLLYNPSFTALLSYMQTSLEIASGYNSAMSVIPQPDTLAAAVFCGGAFCVVLLLALLTDLNSGLYMALFSGALFQAFKHGFVRADGHTYIFFMEFLIVLTVIVLFLANAEHANIRGGSIQRALCVTLTVGMFLIPLYVLNPSVQGLAQTYRSKLNYVLHDIQNVIEHPKADTEEDVLPIAILEIIKDKTVVIMPSELSIGAYNDINMAVMPSLQSYNAYTADLDNRNALFFSGQSAPQYILFSFGAIDERLPLLETPATWMSVFENYQAVLLEEPYLLLEKMDVPYQMELSEEKTQIVSSIDQVALPENQSFIRLNTSLTFWGKLNKFFYQIPPVTITLTYSDGTQRTGRVLPDVLKNGVILSDLPDSLTSMCMRINGIDDGKKIVSFQFGGDGWKYYRDQMEVTFQTIQSPKEACEFNPLRVQEVTLSPDPTIGRQKLDIPQPYAVDWVNGAPLTGQIRITNSGLRITGWALDDTLKCSPDAVYLKFGDQYYRMKQTDRRDVYEYLGGYSGEPLCGYDGWIPADNVLPGEYSVSLVIVCSNETAYYETPVFLTTYMDS